MIRETKLPLKEGSAIKMTLLDEKSKSKVSFKIYFWKRRTYEEILKKVGFKNIQFKKLEVSKESIKKRGKKFWKRFLDKPTLVIIKAVK